MSREAILVVDDEVTYCDVVAEILKSYGFDVHIANNAQEAMGMLGDVKPELILLDMMMPEVDGLTLLRNMRSDPKLAELSILVVTAKAMPEDRLAAFSAGADAFLTKPFSTKELRAALRRFVAVPDTGKLLAR